MSADVTGDSGPDKIVCRLTGDSGTVKIVCRRYWGLEILDQIRLSADVTGDSGPVITAYHC